MLFYIENKHVPIWYGQSSYLVEAHAFACFL
jgi:hypothetical protein